MKKVAPFLVLFLGVAAFAEVDQTKLANSLSRIEDNRKKVGPYQVKVLEQDFWAHHNVFSPEFFASTAIQNRNFPFKEGESFLDIGSGVGVTSVIAAKRFHNRVVALDINPDAVEMTQKNIAAHSLGDVAECRKSDLFSALKPGEKFDTIYWDLPYVESEENAKLDLLRRAVSDPGYVAIKRFFKEVANHVKENGRVIVGFGTLGNYELLEKIAQENGYALEQISSEKHPYRGGISYSLLLLKRIVQTE